VAAMKLEIDSVQLAFDNRKILSDVYARFETGKITGLLGRNGSGKSCFFQVLFGILDADFATIKIDGIYHKDLFKSGLIKYLPQNFIIPNDLNASKAIDYLEANKEKSKAQLEAFGIDLKTPMQDLSGGQRRLAEIILFLNTSSPFVIFDEPFTHIMPVHIEQLQALFLAYKSQKAIIISDHQYEHLLAITDAVYLLKDGRMNAINNLNIKEELVQHHYIRSF
jgi:ABC-type multidrug transport system ATPase subunit